MRKERFPSKHKNKLMPRAEGPYKVVSKVNDNAYKIELPGDYGVHATFNVGDLSPYVDDDGIVELRTIPFKGGGDDTMANGTDPLANDTEASANDTLADGQMADGQMANESSINEIVIHVNDGAKGTHGARLATQTKFIGEPMVNHVCVLSVIFGMTLA